MNALISVITPTYKRLKCLKELWKFLLAQTHSNWEWIVVSAGHDPEVQKFIESLLDPRAHYLYNEWQDDRGTSKRNLGFKKSTGDLVCYVDDDNKIYPNYLRAMSSAFSSDTGYVICSIRMDDKSILKPIFPFEPGKVDTLCFMIRRCIIEEAALEWKYSLIHDHTFISAVSQISKGVFIEDVLGEHRRIGAPFLLHLYLNYAPQFLKAIYRKIKSKFRSLITGNG